MKKRSQEENIAIGVGVTAGLLLFFVLLFFQFFTATAPVQVVEDVPDVQVVEDISEVQVEDISDIGEEQATGQ